MQQEYDLHPLPTQGGDRTLDELSVLIRRAFRDVQANARNALRFALDGGDALAEAQVRILKVTPRRWTRWVTVDCGMKLRTAQLWMQLARHRDLIERKIKEDAGELSLRLAAELVRKPKKPKGPSAPASSPPEAERPLIPTWVVEWNKAPLEEKKAGLERLRLVEFLAVMPNAWRLDIERRVAGRMHAKARRRAA